MRPARGRARAVQLVAGLALTTLLGLGCSGSDEAMRSDMARMEQRVAELERTSGRWQGRIDGLEENVLLLEDRVEAHRLSLERRGLMAARSADDLPRYEPPPQQADYSYMAELPVQRLAPGEDAEAFRQAEPDPAPAGWQAQAAPQEGDALPELVITNDTLQDFVDNHGGPGFEGGSPGAPLAPVVLGDRLPVTRLEPTPSIAEAGLAEPDRDEARTASRQEAADASLDLYQHSLDSFNAGEYGEALSGFQSFLSQGPTDDYADNVYYWIGECHYAQGNYQSALSSFEQVIHDYPDGNKVPDSLLKMGLTYEQLDNREQASQVLSSLVATYPLTEAARRASERLAELN